MFMTIRVLGSVTGHVVIAGIQNYLLILFTITYQIFFLPTVSTSVDHGSLSGMVTKIFTFLKVWAIHSPD